MVWRSCPGPGADAAEALHQTRGPLEEASEAYGQERWQLQQTISLGTHIQQAVALTHLPSDPSWLLLATGGTDKQVHLYVRPPGAGSAFAPACRLAGHENWVRGLDFCHTRGAGGGFELLLASASQDRYGRVWRIGREGEASSAAAGLGPGQQGSEAAAAAAIARYAPKPRFLACGAPHLAELEALLIGHEDWLHSICWRPGPRSGGNDGSIGPLSPAQDRASLRLLTSSMDRSMMLWQHDPASGIWMSGASVGDAGAQCLGYFGGRFAPGGCSILAHGYTGALHLWDLKGPSWVPRHALGGHFAAVAGCCWAMDGACVLSVGEDQTARVFTSVQGHWCEVARPQVRLAGDRVNESRERRRAGSCRGHVPLGAPLAPVCSVSSSASSLHVSAVQVHGHDFTCVTSVARPADGKASASPFLYISGSEEKILRAFEAPQVRPRNPETLNPEAWSCGLSMI